MNTYTFTASTDLDDDEMARELCFAADPCYDDRSNGAICEILTLEGTYRGKVSIEATRMATGTRWHVTTTDADGNDCDEYFAIFHTMANAIQFTAQIFKEAR